MGSCLSNHHRWIRTATIITLCVVSLLPAVSGQPADCMPCKDVRDSIYRIACGESSVIANIDEFLARVGELTAATLSTRTVCDDESPGAGDVERCTEYIEDAIVDKVSVILSEAPAPDDDDDVEGQSDAWELDNFGTLDHTASCDADDGGLDNLAENMIGSDPLNARHRWRRCRSGDDRCFGSLVVLW